MHRKPTKGFFEQDNSAKSKQSFARKKPGNASGSQPSRNVSASSSVPASADAKAKLSTFAFTKPATPRKTPPDLSGDPTTSTSNSPRQDAGLPTPSKPPSGDRDTAGLPTPVRPPPAFLGDPPQTPAPRLNIRDLLLSTEDEKPVPDSEMDDLSGEHVTWAKSTPILRKEGLKRPASSSPPELRTPAGKRLHVHSEMLSSSADPAMQLWKKYGSDSDLAQRPANPAARLFAPDPADRSPSTLRRAIPPGAQTTHNRIRRRQASAPETVSEPHSSHLEDGEPGAVAAPAIKKSSKNSRVVNLVDQVKQNLSRKNQPAASSAPLAGSEDGGIFSSSPPQAPLGREEEEDTTAGFVVPAAPENPPGFEDDDEDDYGDFDIDMETIDEIDRQSQAPRQQPPESQPTVPAPASPDLDEFNDFGDDDLFTGAEFEQLVAQYDSPSQVDPQNRLKRYQVVEVEEGAYRLEGGQSLVQKIIHARDVESNQQHRIILRDSWFDATMVSPGAFVHVVGGFDGHGVCVVDNKHNYIIVNPDFLVSATTVADTVSCMRKAVLQERVKATSDISKPMVYGNVLHAVFQSGLEDSDFSTESLHSHLDRIIADNIEGFYLLKEEMPVAVAHVRSKLPLIQEWAGLFLSSKPNAKATVLDHRGSKTPIVAINKLLEVEERVWSPTYGLKGNIDATIQATIVEPKGKGAAGNSAKTLVVPLELKTGRSRSMAHRAQTMLYTLLASDRYDLNVHMGLLYYMEGNEMIRIPTIKNELRELIIKRNAVAGYMYSRDSLPEMLMDEYSCSRCYAKTSCFVYHKLFEGGTAESSGAKKPFLEMTEHLNVKHELFFKHWDALLTKEEVGSTHFRRELWTMTSSEREAVGRCFGGLVIVPEAISTDHSNQKINKYKYTFKKKTAVSGSNFIESQLSEGDPIVVSDEKGHAALAIGFIFQIRKDRVAVLVDRRVYNARVRQNNFNADCNQLFNGIAEFKNSQQTRLQEEGDGQGEEEVLYRIDKDEFSNGMAKIRNHLVQIMSPDSSDKYRRLIVGLEAPVFKVSCTAYQLGSLAAEFDLNNDQKRAVEKVMSARDYALVLGMPGTGKTTTIAHIIRALVSQGKSVLLTSYTHTAVDNILLKIKKEKFGILRLGSRSKVHPDVQKFAQLADVQYNSFEELRIAFHHPKVVATTCLGINHPIFSDRRFDYCIVDEASQITLPVCLGPIQLANAFVLVGDHYQLPPLVKNPEAKEGGLDISLFKLLSDAQPQAVVNLEHQYRMCEEIMTLSNELIYSGRLKCGTPEVAKRSLKLPDVAKLQNFHRNFDGHHHAPCWLADLLSEDVKACFVDTDNVPAREEKKGDRTINPIEAELTFQIVEGFLNCGVDPSSIGVITVYRSQLRMIQHLLKHREKIEMHTADKFQGRDKEIVVISLVRSNGKGNVGELLRDWRRINVAFTRARSKLIILGSKSTLSSNDLLKNFIGLMERNSWVYSLPSGAHTMHRIAKNTPTNSPSPTRSRRQSNGSPKRISGKANGATFLGSRPVLRNILNEVF